MHTLELIVGFPHRRQHYQQVDTFNWLVGCFGWLSACFALQLPVYRSPLPGTPNKLSRLER